MKRIYIFALAMVALLFVTGCGKKTPEQLIVGHWVAAEPLVMDQGGMKMTISDMQASYKKDGTSTGSAHMKMAGAMLPKPIELEMNIASKWTLKDNVLTETATDAKVKMITQIPGMPDMGKMMSENMKNKPKSSTILQLDKTTLKIKDNESGQVFTMTRK